MQNSTVKPRRQGILRLEAIIPLLIVIGLVWLYGVLFLDGHLRRGLEFLATRANGAEVNIGALKTRWFEPAIEIHDIQVTDANVPERNLVRIGTVRLAMAWDALLRAKVVVEHAEVLQVGINTPRARPGRVLPPQPASDDASDAGALVLAAFKEQLAGNAFGELIALAEGADPAMLLAQLGDDLKTRARLDELQAELARKETRWRERIASLPSLDTVKGLETRLRAVKLDGFRNVQEVQDSLRELDAIRKELETYRASLRETGDALDADTAAWQAAWADVERMAREDVAALQAHFSLPRLDGGNLSRALFGIDVMDTVVVAHDYVERARSYMPPKRSEEEKAVMRPTPHPRARGTDYEFGRPNAYPRFWLKRAVISS